MSRHRRAQSCNICSCAAIAGLQPRNWSMLQRPVITMGHCAEGHRLKCMTCKMDRELYVDCVDDIVQKCTLSTCCVASKVAMGIPNLLSVAALCKQPQLLSPLTEISAWTHNRHPPIFPVWSTIMSRLPSMPCSSLSHSSLRIRESTSSMTEHSRHTSEFSKVSGLHVARASITQRRSNFSVD